MLLKSIRTEKIFKSIFIFTIIFLAINFISSFIKYNEKRINDEIINKIENRMIYITSDNEIDTFDRLKSFFHVQDVYYDLPQIECNVDKIGVYYIKFLNPSINLKNIVKISSNEDGIIIPKKIFDFYKMTSDDNVNIMINKKEISYFVSAFYSDDENNYIYIKKSNEIINNLFKKFDYIVVVDHAENKDEVINLLNKNNYTIKYVNDTLENEYKTYNDLNELLYKFNLFCYVFLVLILLMLTISNIMEKKYIISLLKSTGYSNKLIVAIVYINSLIIFLISNFITLIILVIIDYIFNLL